MIEFYDGTRKFGLSFASRKSKNIRANFRKIEWMATQKTKAAKLQEKLRMATGRSCVLINAATQ